MGPINADSAVIRSGEKTRTPETYAARQPIMTAILVRHGGSIRPLTNDFGLPRSKAIPHSGHVGVDRCRSGYPHYRQRGLAGESSTGSGVEGVVVTSEMETS